METDVQNESEKIVIGSYAQRYGVKISNLQVTARMASPVMQSLSDAERLAWGVAGENGHSYLVAQLNKEKCGSGFVVLAVNQPVGHRILLDMHMSTMRIRIMSVVHPNGIVPVC